MVQKNVPDWLGQFKVTKRHFFENLGQKFSVHCSLRASSLLISRDFKTLAHRLRSLATGSRWTGWGWGNLKVHAGDGSPVLAKTFCLRKSDL